MVQFKVCRGHISFQAPKEKHQLRNHEELPVLSYFPAAVIRSSGRPCLPYQVPGERRQLSGEVKQREKDEMEILHQGRGRRLRAGRVPACNTLRLAQKPELRPWIWGTRQIWI